MMEDYILQKRETNSLSYDVRKVMSALTLDEKQPTKIVGSFQYIVFEYPGDIDMVEEFKSCCTIDSTVISLAKKFKQIAKNIKNLKYTYFGDFKAGFDKRYYIELGVFTEYLVLVKYKPDKIRAKLDQLLQDNLIKEHLYKKLNNMIIDNPTYKEHENFVKEYKKLFILRWTLKEIEQGYKVLKGNITVTLEDALKQKSVVKIDTYSYIQGRFIEITNFYVLESVQKDRSIIKLSSNQAGEDYIKNLKRDLAIYRQPSIKKTMKYAKRLWLKGVYDKDYKLLMRLYPLFSSGSAKLSQIQADIETMQLIISKLKNPPIRIMYRSLQEIKMRMATISASIIPVATSKKVFEIIDDMRQQTPIQNSNNKHDQDIDEIPGLTPTEQFNIKLEKIYDILNNVVNSSTLRYLKKNNIPI